MSEESPFNLTTVAGRLRYARSLRGVGSREACSLAGLSHSAVYAIENSATGGDGASVATLRSLGTVLGVAPEWLAFGVGRGPRADKKG